MVISKQSKSDKQEAQKDNLSRVASKLAWSGTCTPCTLPTDHQKFVSKLERDPPMSFLAIKIFDDHYDQILPHSDELRQLLSTSGNFMGSWLAMLHVSQSRTVLAQRL